MVPFSIPFPALEIQVVIIICNRANSVEYMENFYDQHCVFLRLDSYIFEYIGEISRHVR